MQLLGWTAAALALMLASLWMRAARRFRRQRELLADKFFEERLENLHLRRRNARLAERVRR